MLSLKPSNLDLFCQPSKNKNSVSGRLSAKRHGLHTLVHSPRDITMKGKQRQVKRDISVNIVEIRQNDTSHQTDYYDHLTPVA